ncbi:MAG: ester cyclase [Ardenticatenaceae bacterium]|nr:ester cyclase [Ardenticatenaceae bacterium]
MPASEENKAIVRRYQDAYNRNDLDALDDLVAEDIISHNHAPGVPQGLQGSKLVHQATVAAMPDYHVVTEDLFAEGDKVVARIRMVGTHTGADFLGVPANGRKIDVPAISIFRIADGKIVEHWAQADNTQLMQQLGLMPAP